MPQARSAAFGLADELETFRKELSALAGGAADPDLHRLVAAGLIDFGGRFDAFAFDLAVRLNRLGRVFDETEQTQAD